MFVGFLVLYIFFSKELPTKRIIQSYQSSQGGVCASYVEICVNKICNNLFQRSFRKELFDDAALRMERALIKTPLELEKFRGLSEKAAEIVVQNMKREVDFSDAPEEFRGDLLNSII